MSNRKLFRHSLFAAAITISAAQGTTAVGFQQGQYQPGQPGQQIPQGNTSVTQELNRMFQESGQQMPSMIEKELPNANAPIQGQVRLREPQNQTMPATNTQSNHMQQSTNAPTKGPLLRFFGKFRGHSGPANNPNYRPPVPPDYNNAAPSTANAGVRSVPSNGQGQKSFPQQQNQQPQNAPRTATAQTNNANRPAANQAPRSSAQETTQYTNGAMSRIPPRSGATVQAVTTSQPAAVHSEAENRPRYTQPGSAPGFMSTAGSSTVIHQQPAAAPNTTDKFEKEFIQDNTGGSPRARSAMGKVMTKSAAAVAAKDASSGFENPFLDAGDHPDAAEVLDLDSLIDIPAATKEPVRAEVRKVVQPAPVALAPAAVAIPPVQQPQVQRSSVANQLADELADSAATDADEFGQDSAIAPNENPFTGVQLETSGAGLSNDEESADSLEQEKFGVPAAPVEDFNSNLPSIDLPPVGLADETNDGKLRETPGFEPDQSVGGIEATSPANDSSRAELPPTPDVPEAMNAADTERLRQTAEQQRRQHQQRQILVRAGQTGFKGFCPVTLRERRELVEANPQFTSTFGLQAYTFSSAEAKIAFDTDPSRYAPAAGGSDVVVLVNSGEEQAGQLDFALWYRDRLYLFRSRETMTLFSKDPQRFASQY